MVHFVLKSRLCNALYDASPRLPDCERFAVNAVAAVNRSRVHKLGHAATKSEAVCVRLNGQLAKEAYAGGIQHKPRGCQRSHVIPFARLALLYSREGFRIASHRAPDGCTSMEHAANSRWNDWCWKIMIPIGMYTHNMKVPAERSMRLAYKRASSAGATWCR